MKTASVIARYLAGVIFLVFGLNGFLNFIPLPPTRRALHRRELHVRDRRTAPGSGAPPRMGRRPPGEDASGDCLRV